MRKVTLLIALIPGVIGVAAALWVHHSDRRDLLSQARQSFQQGDFDAAALLAQRYVAEHPQEWQAYHLQAMAMVRLGRYADARPPLQSAMKIVTHSPAVSLTLAQTYSLPAAECIGKADDDGVSMAAVETAVRSLEQANQVLSDARPSASTPEEIASIYGATGLNHCSAAKGLAIMADRLGREASLAEAAGDVGMRDYKRTQAQLASSQQAQHVQQAADDLLHSLQRAREAYFTGQPTPQLVGVISSIARAAAELAIQRNDCGTVIELSRLLAGLEDKAPRAAVLVATQQTRACEPRDAVAQRQRRKQALAQLTHLREQLDASHAAMTDVVPVKLAIAELALSLQQYATAERICDGILARVPKNHDARLLRGRVLMLNGNLQQAERTLFILKTDYPLSAEAQYNYALVTRARGKLQLAREAFKCAADSDPSLTGARQGLVESLLHEGLLESALDEAQAFHWACESDPCSLTMLVRAAVRLQRTELARKALEEALDKYSSDAAMVCSVVEGYQLLDDNGRANEIARQRLNIRPSEPEACLGNARIATRVREYGMAEQLLRDQLATYPNWSELHAALGSVLMKTDRKDWGVQEFRTAAELDPSNTDFTVGLATALFECGRLDECEATLQRICSPDLAASLLHLRLRLLRGEAVPVDEVLQLTGAESEARVTMARAYLLGGQLERCVELCRAELVRHPGDASLQCLLSRAYLLLAQDQIIRPWKQILQSPSSGNLDLSQLLPGKNSPD